MDTTLDPHGVGRLYHRADKINPSGAISALCYPTPRAIPTTGRETWTLRDEAVTCPKCLKILAKRGAEGLPCAS